MRPFYRVWQFWHFLTARPLESKLKEEIKTVLSPPQQRLFGRFSASEQQHSYRVYQTLRRAGHENPDLLAAALLHDVGKTNLPRAWWDRPVVVLGQALFSRAAAQWAQGEARGITRPFVVKAKHAEWGAAAAAAVGCSPTTVTLIRRHHDPPAAETDEKIAALLALLQWADDNS
jgi:putative nucleotidyltransferase with HDIG domain